MLKSPVMVATLRLVYPPVSNQEAQWVKDDPEVERLIRGSDFYVIGARQEATFDVVGDLEEHQMAVTISIGDSLSDTVVLDFATLAENTLDAVPETITVDVGPKIIRAYAAETDDVIQATTELIEWFTTEKLIYDRSCGLPGLSGFEQVREFATYELLYVGIAKTTDTFERLFAGAHHARQKILTNEWPRRPGSRTTDELFLFPLRVDPLVIRTLDFGDTPSDSDPATWKRLQKRVVADAEKAFVHLLDPSYNVEKFASYPRGVDGLWGSGYERYGFVLIENFTFTTATETLYGSGDSRIGMIGNDADMLTTTGTQTELWRSPARPTT